MSLTLICLKLPFVIKEFVCLLYISDVLEKKLNLILLFQSRFNHLIQYVIEETINIYWNVIFIRRFLSCWFQFRILNLFQKYQLLKKKWDFIIVKWSRFRNMWVIYLYVVYILLGKKLFFRNFKVVSFWRRIQLTKQNLILKMWWNKRLKHTLP